MTYWIGLYLLMIFIIGVLAYTFSSLLGVSTIDDSWGKNRRIEKFLGEKIFPWENFMGKFLSGNYYRR